MNDTLMSYDEFKSFCLEHIGTYLEDMEVESIDVVPVERNNQVTFDALNLKIPGMRRTPVIYIQDYYEYYLHNGRVAEIMELIAHAYHSHQEPLFLIDEDNIQIYEKVQPFIIMRVINYEKNQELLVRCPHRKILDLAITYRILFSKIEAGVSTSIIDHRIMQRWSVDEEQLFEVAQQNTLRLFPPVIENVREMIYHSFLADPQFDEDFTNAVQESLDELTELENTARSDCMLYVLSNDCKLNGASALFCSELIHEFAIEKNSDLYILPSSIHEVMLLPKRPDTDLNYLRSILLSANQKVVDAEEILSEHVYLYDKSLKEVLLCV